MGEHNKMDILETNVKHNTEDIRELKKRMNKAEENVSDLKVNHQVTTTTMSAMVESINEIKASLKEESRKRQEDKEDQLKQYKNATWKVAVAIIVAVFLIQLGLK